MRRMEGNGIRFHPDASDEEITETEAVLGVSLPPSIITLYRHGNGMIGNYEILQSEGANEEAFEDMGQFWRLVSLSELRVSYPNLVTFGWNWPEAVCFWTDDESNAMRLSTGGLLEGRIRRLSHDAGDSSFLYRSLESFLNAQAIAGLRGFEYEEAPERDYPPVAPWSEEWTTKEREVTAAMWERFREMPDEDHRPELPPEEISAYHGQRENIASILCSLTPWEDSDTLIPFLEDRDFYIQEYACVSLGRRGYGPAIPSLIAVAQRIIPNSPTAAVKALQRIGTPEALEGLRFLSTAATDRNVQAMAQRAIQALSNP